MGDTRQFDVMHDAPQAIPNEKPQSGFNWNCGLHIHSGYSECWTCIMKQREAAAAGTPPQDAWKEAVIEACVVGHLDWDENDPRKTLSNLIAWECQIALDPAVSKEAQALIDRGAASRASGTEGREALPQDVVNFAMAKAYKGSGVYMCYCGTCTTVRALAASRSGGGENGEKE